MANLITREELAKQSQGICEEVLVAQLTEAHHINLKLKIFHCA